MYQRRPVTIMLALEELGAAVRDARSRAGLSQRDLEALSGVDQSAISRMERGRIPGMGLEKFARVAMVLGKLLLVQPDPPERADAWTRITAKDAGLTDANEQASSDEALLRILVEGFGPDTPGWPPELLDV